MANSVVITTAIPTWEETVARYRLSKADRQFVEKLFDDTESKTRFVKRSAVTGKFVTTVRHGTKSMIVGREKTSGTRRKTSRARKVA